MIGALTASLEEKFLAAPVTLWKDEAEREMCRRFVVSGDVAREIFKSLEVSNVPAPREAERLNALYLAVHGAVLRLLDRELGPVKK